MTGVTDEAPPRRWGTPRWKVRLAWGLVLGLVLGGAGVWAARAAHTWPFGWKRYCWGAWQEGDQDFHLLREEGSRTAEEDPPGPGSPQGSCTLTLSSPDADAWASAGYGPAPADRAERLAWIGERIGGGAVPLPDDLPGLAGPDAGLLVLPPSCDGPGERPTAVGVPRDPSDDPDRTESTARLLLAAANAGMRETGCGEPLRMRSPVLEYAAEQDSLIDSVCGLPGLPGTGDLHTRVLRGPVTDEFQACHQQSGDGLPVLDLVMTAHPRLTALVADAAGSTPPAAGWRGRGTVTGEWAVAQADCGRRTATFLAWPASADTLAALADYGTRRLGCPAITPQGGTR